jgi:hypothetical protein
MEKRILLVEDDASFRDIFTYALEEALAPELLAAVRWRQARGGTLQAMASMPETVEAIKWLTDAEHTRA